MNTDNYINTNTNSELNSEPNGETDETHCAETLLEFPCSFPLKVMGYNRDEFSKQMCAIVQTYVSEPIDDAQLETRPSRTNKFLALTITFKAESKSQLDSIYQALNAHELVTMTL